MNKKTLTKVASSMLVLVMVIVMLMSTIMPAYGEVAESADYIRQLESINTNYEKYLDSSVVMKLPEGVKSTDEISVIVRLDNTTILDAYEDSDKTMSIGEFSLSEDAAEIRAAVSKERAKLLAALDVEGLEYSTGVSYDTIITGFEIVIKAGDFEKTCEIFGDSAQLIVGEVYNVAETKLVNNKVDYYEETGIFNSSNFAYDGSGMVVAVLDTGLDYTHSAFSVKNFTSSKLGLTKDQVSSLLPDTEASRLFDGLAVDDVYLNDKVPFSFDYADSDPDVYSLHNNHGTHVSGVIVGKDDVITGVAPNAQLVSMKIFSDLKDSARSSWILTALEDCVVIGVDVINMSLGTACGFSRETDKEAMSGVYDRLREAGISVVVAASNSYSSAYGSEKNGNLPLTSNPDTGTVGSPSTYRGSLSVASINGEKTPYILYGDTIIYFVEASNAASEEKDFFEEILPEGVESKEYDYVLIPGSGRATDYMGIDVTGKIALVRRGSNTFEEKATAALKAGAAGIIIYNNVAGDIKMSAGMVNIPICSISQDDGEMLAKAETGKIKISRSQKSGPFMSDFSSWGPTPDLRIKPEITAHGGNILSAVTGGSYDRLSGTSMASPNMAGVVALMRQYVMERFPSIANDSVAIAAQVNRLLMSTADVILNQNGNPYAVRKQGAGLANLTSASTTTAYIMTYDRDDGSLMDKSKLELGDDPDKTGVYELKFSVNNFGTTTLVYDVDAYVMTEGVSETKTHKGDTTVTEEGYILEGATVVVTSMSGGSKDGNKITVPAGEIVDVTVTITLGAQDKEYLDKSFANCMYVEGFVRLSAVSGTEISLGAPYLAFYGDWSKAPLFDLDYFETNADELDDSIETLDKTLPDAYATRPIGGLNLDYVNYLGSYYFIQDPSSKIIAADRDYVAISNSNETVHSLRFIWAGMLRNADKVVITITDSATGELVFETVDYDVRKSYGDGGSIYPASIEIEFDAAEYNLKNNTTYDVKVQGYLDFGNGGLETNEKCTFEFPMTADFEAPAVTDCEFYTEYDKDNDKMRLFAKLAIYDNHYSMAMQVGYISEELEYDESGKPYMQATLNAFDSLPVPIYSNRDSTSYVTYELTDYVYDIKANALNKNCFTVSCYDYAMNDATYEIPLPDEFIDFYFESEEGGIQYDAEGNFYTLTLSPNEVYSLYPLAYPTTSWSEMLQYTCAASNVVRVVNNRVIAVGSGAATIIVKSPTSDAYTTIRVTVLDENHPDYEWIDKPVADVFRIDGYKTLKAYYNLSSEDRDIGTTGDMTLFSSDYYSLKMFPSESVELLYTLDAYFPDATEVVFESSDSDIVEIDENGVIVAKEEGFSSVSIRVLLDGRSTYYSQTVSIEVKDPYIRTGPWLTHYFGNGGVVSIPEDLRLTELSGFAFSNFEYVAKDETDEISEDEPDLTKQTYIGDNTITKVIIPEGVEKIGPYAFAGLTALEEVVLPSTLEAIEYGAFFGCNRLHTVEGLEHVKLINAEAFFGCSLNGILDLKNAHAISDYAFAANYYIDGVVLPETLSTLGAYAFAGDTSLETVTVNAESVKYGAYVFTGCTSLTEMTINSAVIPSGAFAGCTSLTDVTIGKDVKQINEFAFYNTKVSTFKVAEGNTTYKPQAEGQYLLSADGKTLLLVAPTVTGKFTLNDSNVLYIGMGAFSANSKLNSVEIPSVVQVGNYAFYMCTRLSEVKLGKLLAVGDYAFASTAITAVPTFDDEMMKIGKYAFAFTSVTEVDIKDGMLVDEGAFSECKKLASVTIGDGAIIGSGAFMLDRNTSLPDPEIENIPYYIEGGKRIYYYVFKSALRELVIGDNVKLGEAAFFGASEIEEVTLGENVEIGDRAFYNATELKSIDLSKVKHIGALAFSGDVHYTFLDNYYSTVYIKDNYYVYRFYAPKLQSVDLSSLLTIGEQAFQYCKELEEVTLGEGVTVVSKDAFSSCDKLASINLEGVNRIEANAFAETALTSVDLSSAVSVGEYAFVYCEQLTDVTLSEVGTDIGEGAFAFCSTLESVENLNYTEEIDSYAFAYSALSSADLSSAKSVGDYAFMKNAVAPFSVTLTDKIEYLGDNPFAMCKIAPFKTTVTETFNGKDYPSETYTFDISETVKVIDGSLYCKVPSGLELITYAGEGKEAVVAEDTVRITGMAFAGTDVVRAILPHSLNSIGHKAFYACDKLTTVVFKSYEAPNLEEEFDSEYHGNFDSIPATGTYEFTLNDGTENGQTVYKEGLGIVPYYMWNVTSDKYCNVYYGANFVDYIGKVDNNLVMVRPSNGLYYETFIYGQYFGTVIDGSLAADDITLAAVEAINRLPNPVKLSDEALVIAARAAYDRIATDEQKALIYDQYMLLAAAERRITALKGNDDTNDNPGDGNTGNGSTDGEEPKDNTVVVIVITAVLIVLGTAAILVRFFLDKKKESSLIAKPTEPEAETEAPEAEAVAEPEAEAEAPEAEAPEAEAVAEPEADSEEKTENGTNEN